MTSLPSGGQQLRDYQILGRIGSGGMGVVFQARDLKLNRTVALKFLPETLYADAGDRRGLLDEARAVSALDHPNICTIFGLEETGDGGLFMVMAYYDGGTLADRIAQGPIAPMQAVDILTAVVSGLAAAHRQRIVHRDIKPSNILLTRQGTVKIVDFGLARLVTSASQTLSIGASGTVAYMSPEQLRGEPVDQRTDIWAVGITAAEMLTGRHPFKKDNMGAMAYSIWHDAPSISGDLFAATPPELQAIVYKCLSKDPALRYADCDALLADLEQVRAQMRAPDAAGARRSSGRNRKLLQNTIAAAGAAKPARPGRGAWIAAGAAVAVILILLAIPAMRDRLVGALFSPGEKHIAVLPLEVAGDDPTTRAQASGLVDSLTGALSNLDKDQKTLWVVPASLVQAQKVDTPAAALKELGATIVVTGSFERADKHVAMHLNVINAKTQREIGAVPVSNEEGDLDALQREAVTQLGRLLNVSGSSDAVAGGSNVPAAYDQYLEALDAMQRFDKPGNLDLAISRLQSATMQDVSFALAYAKLGEAYRLKYKADRNTKWLQQAQENVEKALKLNPQLPSAYVTLGAIHAITGKGELAMSEFQQALALDSRNFDATIDLAWSYQQAGRLAEAEAEYKRAIALRPTYWSGYNELALFYDGQGRYEEAIAQVKQAIQLTPDNPTAYVNLSAFYLDKGDSESYADAERALQQALTIAPEYGAYANLGELYMREKRYAESAAMSEKALAMNARDVTPWFNAVYAYRWLKQNSKADAALARVQQILEAAVKMDPQDAESQSWLALTYAQQGQPQKALPHIQAALALSPGTPQIAINAIEVYGRSGDAKTALKLIEQAKQSKIPLANLQFDPGMQSLLTKSQAIAP